MAGEKTEAPSPKKLRDARQKGQVTRSQDLVGAGVLLFTVLVIKATGPSTWNRMQEIVRGGLLRTNSSDLTPSMVMALFQDSLLLLVQTTLPLFAIGAVGAVVLNVGQGGLILSGGPLTPKLNRLNPIAGMKRIFLSPSAGVNLGKSLAKMAVIAVVVYMVMKDQVAEMVGLGAKGIPEATMHLAKLSFEIALKSATALFILGVADYAWQRRQFLSQLKMTKEEVKQEMKESDGDPFMKAQVRRRRQEMLNRMMTAVPDADIVVTNPTHYAVAIKYDPLTMAAPIVVAKGERLIALRIKEIALKSGVPVLEEPPLARALYASVDIGHPVPANLYRAVAEVLAWLYALRDRRPYKWQRTGD